MSKLRSVSVCLLAGLLPLPALFAAAPPGGVPVVESVGESERVAGRTIEEWRELMKSLELTSPAAAEAVPGLIAVCRHPGAPETTRMQAAYTLGRMGATADAAVPTLIELLDISGSSPADSDGAGRDGESPAGTTRWAAKALALLGTTAAPATPALIEVATHSERGMPSRLAATEALGRIGGAHADAIPALMQLAADPTPGDVANFDQQQLRAAAIDSLALIGPAASAAVPLLIRLTREDTSDLRKRSAAALGAMGAAAGISTEALVDLVLFDEMPEVRDAATASLARIGEAGESALAQLLLDEEAEVRRRAATGLAAMLRPPVASRTPLVAALTDDDVGVQLEAVAALQRTDVDPRLLIDVLLGAVQNPDRPLRMRSYRLLVSMRGQRDAILPRLQALADDERSHVRQAARKAIDELNEVAP